MTALPSHLRLAAVDGKRQRGVKASAIGPPVYRPLDRATMITLDVLLGSAERAAGAVDAIWDAARTDDGPVVLMALAREASIEMDTAVRAVRRLYKDLA
jgi:hypothetical protein